jgi:hypothetical protein
MSFNLYIALAFTTYATLLAFTQVTLMFLNVYITVLLYQSAPTFVSHLFGLAIRIKFVRNH